MDRNVVPSTFVILSIKQYLLADLFIFLSVNVISNFIGFSIPPSFSYWWVLMLMYFPQRKTNGSNTNWKNVKETTTPSLVYLFDFPRRLKEITFLSFCWDPPMDYKDSICVTRRQWRRFLVKGWITIGCRQLWRMTRSMLITIPSGFSVTWEVGPLPGKRFLSFCRESQVHKSWGLGQNGSGHANHPHKEREGQGLPVACLRHSPPWWRGNSKDTNQKINTSGGKNPNRDNQLGARSLLPDCSCSPNQIYIDIVWEVILTLKINWWFDLDDSPPPPPSSRPWKLINVFFFHRRYMKGG